MDFIRSFDVELDKQVYYAGEQLTGHVYLEAEDNMRLQNIKVFLRGKAHANWKITRAGERRAIKHDEHYIDERLLLWGKDDDDSHQGIPILTRGRHRYPFHFQLPQTALPCSFESKIGTIRYYVRVHVNIPYASCPQCIRYFTIIGPHVDCMDERFLIPVQAVAKRNSCSLCCGKGPLLLRASMERTSFVCGEPIKLKAEVQNGSDSEVWVLCKLIQYVEYFINKGVLGLSKEVRHTVLEAESDKVPAHDTSRLDELVDRLVVPVMPPTMVEVCGLIQIYYTLKLYLETSKGKGEAAEINMPITIATVPFRIPTASMPEIYYGTGEDIGSRARFILQTRSSPLQKEQNKDSVVKEKLKSYARRRLQNEFSKQKLEIANPTVEGGMYISPEFQLGQVYMGDEVDPETDQTILYRPVYVCVTGDQPPACTDTHLLQVPVRQTGRSRENLSGSKEGIQENITCSHSAQQQQHMVKLFQVHDDGGGGTAGSGKVGKPVVEDKFLKEITAKIANRQMQITNAEGEDKEGADSESQAPQSAIDCQVEMMRKQKKSNDIVHKALVNELRKHLSESDEVVEPEKPAVGYKKMTGLKKVSDSSSSMDPNKRMKTEELKDVRQDTFEETSRNVRQVHDISQAQEIVSAIQTFNANYASENSNQFMEPVAETLGQGEDFEYTEHSALLQGSCGENFRMEIDSKESESEKIHSGRLTVVGGSSEANEESMQKLIEDLPSSISEVPSEHLHSFLDQAESMGTEDVALDSEMLLQMLPEREENKGKCVPVLEDNLRVDIPPSSNPADADVQVDKKLCSPKVAPKPKQNVRHSFPATHPVSGEATSDGQGLTVELSKRPKSQAVESEASQYSQHEDNISAV